LREGLQKTIASPDVFRFASRQHRLALLDASSPEQPIMRDSEHRGNLVSMRAIGGSVRSMMEQPE
jgi:hypothetical protein